MNHEAIYAVYPQVKSIVDNKDGTVTAYDANGSVVQIDITIVTPKAQELEFEWAIKALRRKRDSKLAETDWWASSDLTMTDEQRDYRQALRDITDTYSSLDDVVWPVKPE